MPDANGEQDLGNGFTRLPNGLIRTADGQIVNDSGDLMLEGKDGKWDYADGRNDVYKSNNKYTTVENGEVITNGMVNTPERLVHALRDENSDASQAYNWDGKLGGAADDVAWNNLKEDEVRGRAAPSVDLWNDQKSRDTQMAGARGFQGMLAGTGPSLANAQQQRGISQAGMAAGAAQAGATRGNMAAAGRAGMMTASQGMRGAVTGAVDQRMNETNAAVSGLGAASNAIYSADAASADKRANLELQNRKQNDEAAAGFAQRGINVRQAQMASQMDRQNQRMRSVEQVYGTTIARDTAAREQKDKLIGAGLNAIGVGTSVFSDMYSDQRLKKDIKDGTADVRSAMDSLKPKKYRYRDMHNLPSDERTGIMAQDLEKSEMGKATVKDTEIGKAVDVSKGLGLALAGMADLHSRLKKIEK